MNLINGALQNFARLIGVSPRHAEPMLLEGERAAQALLSRRALLGASAALAGAAAFSFARPPQRVLPLCSWTSVSVAFKGQKVAAMVYAGATERCAGLRDGQEVEFTVAVS